jgi:DNA-binding FadR family transcriptional regulator
MIDGQGRSTETSQRTVEVVDDALSRLLASPDLRPGQRLPTERALADQLSVPRSAVRTALARLEARGRVKRIIGSGTYVADPAEDATRPSREAPGDKDASPLEILETRLLVEPRLAQMVVGRANGADIARIAAAWRQGEAATEFAAFEICDGRFHQSIADATHNRLMIEVYKTISTSRALAEWGELKRRSITEERRQIYNREHAEIVAALQARDATRAEAAIEAHLLTVRRNMLGF